MCMTCVFGQSKACPVFNAIFAVAFETFYLGGGCGGGGEVLGLFSVNLIFFFLFPYMSSTTVCLFLSLFA